MRVTRLPGSSAGARLRAIGFTADAHRAQARSADRTADAPRYDRYPATISRTTAFWKNDAQQKTPHRCGVFRL